MKIRNLLLVLMLGASAVLMAQATELFISEYVEGSSYNKAIEIFNGTGAAVNLSQYSLKKQTNGAGSFGNELVLSGTLANNDVYVIVCSQTGGTNLANEPYVDLATTSQAMTFNGNDAVALYRSGIQIDVVGIVNDPNNWGQDMTLIRNPNIASPTVNFSLTNWTQHPQNYFANLGMHTFNPSGDPLAATPTFNPPAGVFSSAISVTISTTTANATIYYTTDGSIPTTSSTVYTNPVNVSATTTIKAIATAPGHQTSQLATALYIFPVMVSNMAALRSQNADGITQYCMSGTAILTFKQTYRNKKYVQDTTAGIEIDDPTGVITTQYQIGDGIANITGTLGVYQNNLQWTPSVNPGAPVSTGNEIIPVLVTINELNTNFETYEGRLVLLNNVEFVNPTGNFATGSNYIVSDGANQITFRTNFYEADYIGQPIPTGFISIRAICIQYGTTYQICARSMLDFGPVSNGDVIGIVPAVALMGNYPNPFRPNTAIAINVQKAQKVEVEIYNCKGQLVKYLTTNALNPGIHTLSWNGKDEAGRKASPGIYFYRLKNADYSSSKKMVLLK